MTQDSAHLHIRKVREDSGLSQNMMAEKLGVGRTTYIAFETGRTRLYNKLVGKMSRYLGISEEELLYGARPEEGFLYDQASLDEWKKSIIEDYERRLTILQEKLASANRVISMQETNMKTLTETNHYLLQQLRKND